MGQEVTCAAQRSGSVPSRAHLLLEKGRPWMGPLVGRAVTEHPGWRAELAHAQPERASVNSRPEGTHLQERRCQSICAQVNLEQVQTEDETTSK